ncbi:MAG: CHAT domain-containing protein [Cyanothece sp. SIO2G6]|nr:CHAT domain-containing protein [Cyanothece sp. SIO2G6]
MLRVDGNFDFQGNEIVTTGEQNYQGLITFGLDTQLTGSIISFNESIDSDNISLDILGDANFAQDITLNSLSVSGITNTNTNNITPSRITTTGLQTYSDNVILNGDTIFDTNGGEITFTGTVNGPHDLTVNAGEGAIRFAESIGDVNALNNAIFSTTNTLVIEHGLASLGTLDITASQLDLGGYIQVASGDVAIPMAIRLIKDTTIEATTGAILLDNEVTSPAGTNNLNLSANNNIATQFIETNGGNLDIRSTNGSITIGNLSTTNTTNKDNLGGNINLGNLVLTDDLLLTSGGGAIEFLGTVDGSHTLTVNADSGDITFNNAIGSLTPIVDLSLDNTGTVTLPAQTILSGTFEQANASSVNLGGNLIAENNITFNSPLQLTEATTITTGNNGDIRLATVTQTQPTRLTANANGSLTTVDINLDQVDLTAINDLTAGEITTTGTINLASTNGAINVDRLDGTAITATSNGDLAISGAIAATGTVNLTSTTGAIESGNITGTDIAIATPNTITTGDITAAGSLDVTAAGDLTLGAIATTAGANLSTVTGDITTRAIDNRDGALQIQTGEGAIATGNITSPGADVSLQATAGITANQISTSTATGNAGNIRLNSTDGTFQIRRLLATSDNGEGGDILFDSLVNLTDDLRIRTDGGAVEFFGTVNSDGDLRINAEDGAIAFQRPATLNNLTLNTAGELLIANGLSVAGPLDFPAADRTRLGGRITIGQGDIEIPSPITLLDQTWIIAEAGAIALTRNVRSNGNDGNDLTLRARDGGITTANITTTGDVAFLTRNNDITVGDITVAGNTINLIASGNSTVVTAGDLSTSADAGGGEVTVEAGFEITTGNIDTSAIDGDGGDVSLDPTGDVVVGSINTQSLNAAGGDIEVRTQSLFRATEDFITNPTAENLDGIFASLSALGATDGGDITIFHDGGARFIPFNVDNLIQNGTIGAIASGTRDQPNIIPAGESYPGRYTQPSDFGTIDLVTDTISITLEIDEETQRDDGAVPTVTFGLEAYFTGLFEAYFSQLADTRIKSLSEVQDTLRQIELETGVRSAILYAFFAPDAAFQLWNEVEDIHPGVFSIDQLGTLYPDQLAAEEAFLREQFALESDITWVDLLDRASANATELSAGDRRNLVQPRKDDRLGLVLVMPNTVEYVDDSPVTREQAANNLREFRDELFKEEDGRVSNYQSFAADFYRWLISDGISAASSANGIEHISFVLDHELRGLPIAALQDPEGNPILDRFSVGLMPSFSLTDTRYVPFEQSQILAMGTDEFADELDPLPAVPFELTTINNLAPDQWNQVLLFPDDDFTSSNLRTAHQTHAPEAIHLATHAQFNHTTPDQSYLYFANGDRLSLTELGEFGLNDPHVNLMLLSACRTAIGSEQAELGFVGIAAQSQITSVLGSLWKVDDWPTAMFMIALHHTLVEAGVDPDELEEDEGDAMIKAIALQQVQQAFINGHISLEPIAPDSGTDTYQMVWNYSDGREPDIWPIPDNIDTTDIENWSLLHPLYWSSFVVVGSPW